MRDLFVDYNRLYELLTMLDGEAARRAIRTIDGGGLVPLADHLFGQYEVSGNGCGMGAWSRGSLADDDDEVFVLEERAVLVSVNRSLGVVRLERSVPEEAIDPERLMGEFDLPEAKARGLANRYRKRLAGTEEGGPGRGAALQRPVEPVEGDRARARRDRRRRRRGRALALTTSCTAVQLLTAASPGGRSFMIVRNRLMARPTMATLDVEMSRSDARWRADAQDRLERLIWSVADERLEHLRDADLGEDRSLAAALFKIQCEGIEFVWKATLGDGEDVVERFQDARRGEGLRLSNAWDGAADSRHWIAPIVVALNEHGGAQPVDWPRPSGDRRLVLVERTEGNRTKLVSDPFAHDEAVRALELIRQLEPVKMVRLEREKKARGMSGGAAAARPGSGHRGPLRVVRCGTDRFDLRTDGGRFTFTLSLSSEIRRKGEEAARKVSREGLPPGTASLCFAMHLDGMLSAVEATVPSEASFLAALASRLEEEKAIVREAIDGAAPGGANRGETLARTPVTSIEVARERRRERKGFD